LWISFHYVLPLASVIAWGSFLFYPVGFRPWFSGVHAPYGCIRPSGFPLTVQGIAAFLCAPWFVNELFSILQPYYNDNNNIVKHYFHISRFASYRNHYECKNN